jgi:hypothetical protein
MKKKTRLLFVQEEFVSYRAFTELAQFIEAKY